MSLRIFYERKRNFIIWTNDHPILWRIYAALGGDELKTNGAPLRYITVLFYHL